VPDSHTDAQRPQLASAESARSRAVRAFLAAEAAPTKPVQTRPAWMDEVITPLRIEDVLEDDELAAWDAEVLADEAARAAALDAAPVGGYEHWHDEETRTGGFIFIPRDAEPWTAEAPPTRWDYDEQVSAAETLLEEVRAQAAPRHDEPETVRDVLLTEIKGPCRMGKHQHLQHEAKSEVMNAYRNCKTLKCPRCAPMNILRPIRETLQTWSGDPIYRHVFANAEEWQNSLRGKALATLYKNPRRYGVVNIASGERWIFTPGPADDGTGEPLGDGVGVALTDALLASSATGRRYTKPKASPNPTDEPEPEETEEEKGEGWVAAELPHYMTPEMANRYAEEAVGRVIEWSTTPRAGYWRCYHAKGLTPAEFAAVREKLAPFIEEARREKIDCREIVRNFDALLQLSALDGRASATSFAEAAAISPSAARARLNALHERGSVERLRDGRSFVYVLPALEPTPA
jgi:hypothetical protein